MKKNCFFLIFIFPKDVWSEIGTGVSSNVTQSIMNANRRTMVSQKVLIEKIFVKINMF